LPKSPETKRRGHTPHRPPRSLPHADGHRRTASWKARLRRKALQSQPRRRRDARRSTKEIRQARANGHAAALFETYHRNRRENSRWRDWPRLHGKSLVQKHAKIIRHGKRDRRAVISRLGSLARSGAAPRISR